MANKKLSKEPKRTHFRVGSRKSPLAMVQTRYIIECMSKIFPEFTFEIVNFDTRGDQILSIALPKIGDKGLFTKELEDALTGGSIDFVVHSLKDLPCQTSPENLIIAGIPEREDPNDALVVAKRWQGLRKSLADFGENSVIGTSSLRRISQLKHKYPYLKFETIRGNLQTRFAKLDDEVDKKFDAIILAAAGLKRMGYADRITEILSPEVCLHAASQGALGVQCRHDDLTVIRMLNRLNHEETVLQCVAERTFLAKLEGGCSAPVGINTKITADSISMEGVVLDLEGTQRIGDRFEISMKAEPNCPLLTQVDPQQKELIYKHYVKAESSSDEARTSRGSGDQTSNKTAADRSTQKHSLDESDSEEEATTAEGTSSNQTKKIKKSADVDAEAEEALEAGAPAKQYSFIVDLTIEENKLVKAELCGFHLAEKLKENGAEALIVDAKAKVAAKH